VSQYPDGSYLVETDAADIFYFSASEVKRVSAIPLKSKGYMGLVEAGVGVPMSISVVNGYRFSPSFFLGLGIGYGRHLDNYYHDDVLIYLQARTELSGRKLRKTTPYIAFNLGMSNLEIRDYYENTGDPYYLSHTLFMVEFSAGLRSYCRNHGALWYGIAVGWEYYFTLGLKLAYSF
jgi:hypothetical protein